MIFAILQERQNMKWAVAVITIICGYTCNHNIICEAAATNEVVQESDNEEAGRQSDLAELLKYENTNLLYFAYGGPGGQDVVEKINVLADRIRQRPFSPLYICRMRDTWGVTNIVYVEGNYPWGYPSDLILRVAAVSPSNSVSAEFVLGHRRLPSRFEVGSITNRTSSGEAHGRKQEPASYDVLDIYMAWQPSGEIATPFRMRLGPGKRGDICVPERMDQAAQDTARKLAEPVR